MQLIFSDFLELLICNNLRILHCGMSGSKGGGVIGSKGLLRAKAKEEICFLFRSNIMVPYRVCSLSSNFNLKLRSGYLSVCPQMLYFCMICMIFSVILMLVTDGCSLYRYNRTPCKWNPVCI